MPEVVPIPDEGLGNSSYVVDLEDGRLLALDPGRDPTPYLRVAERRRAKIAYAVETHLHADFVSGSRELAAYGAKVVASVASGLEFPHAPLGDGEELDLNGLTLRALATPGHTPEHLSYLLLDGARPLAVFSGGAMLPGSVARTDLISPEQTEPLARALYRSVRENLFSLPDDIVVYPTHGTGTTFCAAAPGGPRATTTIGQERVSNPLFAAPDEDAFVEQLIAGYGSYPSYFSRLRAVNQRGPRLYGEHPPVLELLSATKVREMMEHGAEVIDARPIGQFATGHIPGSLSNELRPAFATWLGWLVPDDRPLVFVLNDDQDRTDVVRQSLKIGYENIAGELGGGLAAWRQAGFEEDLITLVTPSELRHEPGQIIDVRQKSEFAQSHVKSALNVELGSLGRATSAFSSGPMTVMCGHGERAMTAASLLARLGRRDLSVLLGGPDDLPGTMLA